MKIPHLKYIQALICGRTSPDDILVELNKWSLPFPAHDINDIYENIRKKDPTFFKSKKKNRIDRDIIDNLEITPMVTLKFNYGAGMDLTPVVDAFKLLENNNIRSMLYAMILAGMYMEDIELTINEKFDDLNATSGAIMAFKHYFFNLKDYSYQEKLTLEKEFVQDVNSKRMFKIALKGDKDYMLWKMGAAPQKSLDTMLREMLDDSFYLFKEKARNDADTATRFGALALKLADKLERISDTQNKADDIFADLSFENPDQKKIIKDMETFSPPTAEEVGAETSPVFKEDISAELPVSIPEYKPPVNLDEED